MINLILKAMKKVAVQNIYGNFAGVILSTSFFGKSVVKLDHLPDSLAGLKKAVLVSSPELTICERLKDIDSSIVDQKVSTLIDDLGLDIRKLAIYISLVEVGSDKHKETLVVIVQKDKLDNVLAEFSSHDCRVEGLLAEQLAVHKIVEAEITSEETQLILHIGEKFTQIYLLDKYGPVKTYPFNIANEELIPTVQKFIKEQEYCRQGVYFGKRSLSFDQKLFEEQTKIRLSDGIKSLERFSQSQKQDISNIQDLHELVPVLAAVLVSKESELLAIDHKPQKRIKIRTAHVTPSWKGIFLGLVVAGLTTLLIMRGVSFLQQKPNNTTSVDSSKTLPTPTPKPIVVVKAEDIKVRVLNGSGIPGEAGKYAAILEEAKFEVIEVGNALTYDYDTSEIRYKEGNKAELDLVLENLEDLSTSEDFLDVDDQADVEIIVGSN